MSNSSTPKADSSHRFRLFSPVLAGATLRERMFACLGALIAIALTGMVSGYFFGHGSHLPLIVAPMGASAVLLFAVPASPLAQPWSIIGGNTISAMMGILAAHFIHEPIIAIGVGVSLAIGAMSFTRCLHPPGGAAALTAVLGGPAVANWGLLFPFVPVALNSCILVALGILFHKLGRRNYPHVAVPAPFNTHQTIDPPSAVRIGFREEDVDAALAKFEETFDIDRGDLSRLLRQVEVEAAVRSHGAVTCADIMSRDLIAVGENATAEEARALLLKHNIRTLPVKDGSGRLIGTVGLRELMHAERLVGHTAAAVTGLPDAPAISLLPHLTDGRTHAVVIVDAGGHMVGLISQTDLLSAMAHMLPEQMAQSAA
ncbi:HPP family protein [Rhizobium mesoamericanum]|uniref:CBS domain containing membrane protein n=1 Tax=Rhizobium mesoamericanum STM3625 TaxID=1211777 RepID=K0Q1S1_9HYPH|nr:HPP family protein [Rhizobium mesoamericanum]CCM76384.1 CBS domain containing membrane protein [Rhizobium mesoamericanum STM3625]